jgi:hypothetical protein
MVRCKLMLVVVAALVAAGPAAPGMLPSVVRELKGICQSDVEGYDIWLDPAGGGTQLELTAKPVFDWTNPVRAAGQYGAAYVWTNAGRPEVIGTFFVEMHSSGEKLVFHEFHSLSAANLEARRNGETPWAPEEPGLAFQQLRGVPAPAQAAQQRLTQMKTISRDFSAEGGNQMKRWKLKLQAEPLFRYQTGDDAEDGALFAFLTPEGTDPEAILVLETTENKTRWQYSIARFSDLSQEVKHKGKRVYQWIRPNDGVGVMGAPHEKYYSRVAKRIGADGKEITQEPAANTSQ